MVVNEPFDTFRLAAGELSEHPSNGGLKPALLIPYGGSTSLEHEVGKTLENLRAGR
jgi:hypothetical protein